MLRILFVFIICIPGLSWACTCAGYSSFLKGSLGPRGDNIVIAVVENVENLNHGVRVKIIDVLKGNLDKSEIAIWGDPGHLCRGPFVDGVGRRWVAAVNRIDSLSTDEVQGDFETGSCMASALKIQEDDVIGMILGQSASMKMKLDEFKLVVKSPKDYLVPQIMCQVTTTYRNQDDHVDYFKKVEAEANLNSGGTIAMDFVAKSEDNKDFKGRVEGVILREQPDQVFSRAKMKVQATIPDLIQSLQLDQTVELPVALYSRFVASSYAETQLFCSVDAKLK